MLHQRKEKRTQDVIVESYCTCDKCKKRIKQKPYDAFDFDFELKTGFAYPSGSGGKKQVMDLCQECATELVEKLKNDGYAIREIDWCY